MFSNKSSFFINFFLGYDYLRLKFTIYQVKSGKTKLTVGDTLSSKCDNTYSETPLLNSLTIRQFFAENLALRVWSTKISSLQTIFMGIIELSRVDYLGNRLRIINLTYLISNIRQFLPENRLLKYYLIVEFNYNISNLPRGYFPVK